MADPNGATAGNGAGFKWAVVIALASAQFIMVLDSTVMNVSIQKVIDDLDTTVTKMQLAIATYTLTMAALMMIGGKIGDIIGRRLAFRIGLGLFGLGAGITAAAPNMTVLIMGWSIIEAMGAALMIPAVAALIALNYQGRDRAISYGIIGGVIGASAAAGPIIGGWVSTTYSWRVVFAAEVVIVVGLLLASRFVRDPGRDGAAPKLDLVGALLSAGGLALAVLGIVQSTDWGWIHPREALTIGGTEITPFGFSAVPFLILGGVVLLFAFVRWERRLGERGGDTLIQLSMFRIPRLRAGLATTAVMMMTMSGAFFVLPLYLQIVLGNDPLDTGLKILPLSVAVFVFSLGTSRLSAQLAPKRVVRVGMVVILVGVALMLLSIEPTLQSFEFLASMAILGSGIGMLGSQIGNVNMSAVEADQTSEVGGLQGTAQNLGMALGTAIIGSILLTSLTGAFDNNVESNPDLPAQVRASVVAESNKELQFVPADVTAELARKQGMTEAKASSLERDYSEAQIRALKTALGGVGIIVLLGLLTATRHLPARPLVQKDGSPAAVA